MFEASIDDESIELRREVKNVVGTEVTVRLDATTAKQLVSKNEDHPWDWYVLLDPLVERRLYGKKLKQSLKAPAGIGTSCHRTEWRAIYPKAYKVVCWGFPDEHRPFFACNGIRVMDPSKSFAYPCSWASAQIPFTLPSVSVIDEDGALPLTLQRYGLETSSYPFDKELAGDITKDFCAHILLHSPESPTHLFERPFYPLRETRDEGNWHPFPPVGPFAATLNGTVMLHPWHIKRERIEVVLSATIDITELECFGRVTERISGLALYPLGLETIISAPGQYGFYGQDDKFVGSRTPGFKILLIESESLFEDRWEREEWNDILSDVKSSKRVIKLASDDYIVSVGKPHPDKGVLDSIYSELKGEPSAVVLVSFDPALMEAPASPFTRVWSQILKRGTIPYGLGVRRKEFAEAYETLKDYIKSWERPPKSSWRYKYFENSLTTRES